MKIPGTENALWPFFSPDGQWIAFTQGQKLKRVRVEGGTPLVICDAGWGGGAWRSDDTIVFTREYTSGLWKVSARGGTPEKLTDPDPNRGELGHFWPQFLPDGRHVLYTRFSTPLERSRIAVYSLDTREERTLIEGAMYGWYAPTGHLLYTGKDSIIAAAFDAQRLAVTGTAVPVLDDVHANFTDANAQFSISPDGTMSYVRASSARIGGELLWADRKGTLQPAVPGIRLYADQP